MALGMVSYKQLVPGKFFLISPFNFFVIVIAKCQVFSE